MKNVRASHFLSTLVCLAAATASAPLASAQTPPTVYQTTLEEPGQLTTEISTETLLSILAARSEPVFDVRTAKEYAIAHIPGTINIYEKEVDQIAALYPDRSAPMILYCNGPFCGKSKRLSEELLAAGFTSVRRYQLGIPVWRALVGLTEIELEAVQQVFQKDRTAVFLDARGSDEFGAGSLPGARSIPQGAVQPGKDIGEVRKAKDDGRLPMEDHNTRIVVFGRDATQARALAEAIVREAFHNVSYFSGTFDALRSAVK